jgi:hypothetical protein
MKHKSTTERILAKMFDSKLPPGSISLSRHGEIEIVISTFHLLVKSLDFNRRLDKKLKSYVEKFIRTRGFEPAGPGDFKALAGEEYIEYYTTTTSQIDKLLSEDFIAITIATEEGNMVLLEAGDYYFSAKRLRGFIGEIPSMNAVVVCENNHMWEGDYHLYPGNSYEWEGAWKRYHTALQKMPVFDLKSRTLWLDGSEKEISTLTLAQAVAIQTGRRHIEGIITVDGDDVMCPVCGAKLYAGTP